MLNESGQPFDILLVEDESADAHLVRTAIKQCNFTCHLHHVMDGIDALEFLNRKTERYAGAPRPDFILLDLNMPRMNGREFLASVKADERFSSIPVIVLTTSDAERDVDASYRLGAAGFITKPVDMDKFIEVMCQMGAYWLNLARLPKKE